MKQPVQPKQEDCCNSGCNPCIFDVYEKQIKLYQSFQQNGELTDILTENAMSQLEYRSYFVVKNIDVCKQHVLLLFKKDDTISGQQVFWKPGEHFLVKYSAANYSCTRAYTPIKIELELCVNYDFAILVKRYENGLVSNYLCDLNVGEKTCWRGPYGNFKLDCNQVNRIVMIAQGTGIAPLFSIIQYILKDDENMTKIILLYCCKSIDTILLRDELYMFKSYWNFNYIIHLCDKIGKHSLKYKEPISSERLNMKDLSTLKPFTETDQFLLCGSDEFIKCYSVGLLAHNVNEDKIVKF